MSVLTSKRNSIPTLSTPLFEQGPVFTPSPMYSPTQVYSPSSVIAPKVSSPVWGWENSRAWDTTNCVPFVNVLENQRELVLEVAVPGIEKEDLCIEIDNDTITVRTENQIPVNVKGIYKHREFAFNTFCRTFQMPEHVVIDKIKATCENGILFICIPKTGMFSSFRVN